MIAPYSSRKSNSRSPSSLSSRLAQSLVTRSSSPASVLAVNARPTYPPMPRMFWRIHEDHHRHVYRRGADPVGRRTMRRTEGIGVEYGPKHVVIAAQRVELVPVVPVQGCFIPHPLPNRLRISVDLVVKGVIVEIFRVAIDSRHCTPAIGIHARILGSRVSPK